MKDLEITNCPKTLGSSSGSTQRKVKVYIPAKPTYMTDGKSISSYKVSASEVEQGYHGSAYSITKRKHIE